MLLARYPQEVECRTDAAWVATDQVSPAPLRLPGLDGLRAIAVSAVMLFHADFRWARGGYLGVDLFFVISGFLITGLLAREVDATGRLDLGHFYWRRAKRLLPASWLMMAAIVVAAALIARDALPHLRGDSVASLLYITNWELLHANTSYFEAMGRPPLLQHLWSLAIEEQFYILWAPLALLVLPRAGRRALAFLAILLGLASAAWMYLLAHKLGYPDQGDPSRLYFGTDTHAFALLLGAALGLLWEPARSLRSPGVAGRGFGLLLGLTALVGMFALFATMGEETPTLYPWGFLLAAIASLTLVATAVHPALAMGRWLDVHPLRWIGERSYGIYLWHWPIFMLTRPGIDLRGMGANETFALRVVITVVIAALSYRFVEMPIRHGAIGRILHDARLRSRRLHAWSRGLAMALGIALAFGSMGVILWQAPVDASPAQDVREALSVDAPITPIHPSAPVDPAKDTKSKKTYTALTVSLADTAVVTSTASVEEPVVPVPTPEADAPSDGPAVETFSGADVTAIGDSVLLGASRLLKASLPGVDVHATMGWQAADLIRQLKALQSAGLVRPAVLLHLGTNGYVTEDQLREMLSMLAGCKRVVLVNTHVPRRWMEANNALIDRVAPDFPNVVVVRWNDVSDDQPDYFVSDGVHLTTIGQRVFIADILRTGHLVRDEKNAQAREKTPDETPPPAIHPSNTLVLAPQPAASNAYWRKMALCESDANWTHAGRHSGGLGITLEDWTSWGGTDFAPTPGEAKPEQQIEVANRISTQGWTSPAGVLVKPVGFDRWRCVAALGHPPSTSPYTYTPESVIAQSFHLGERGEVVRDLQRLLGETTDGVYSRKLRKKHFAYLKQHGLDETLAASEP
ncbi:acyltransferase family protein [Dyella flagellata]|uniref:Peptidoglycan/LPS O-acetylase OafA/YrhL, contains acyltransferase and SGNH-hydrolase domains n=1 Tax=Dyella flagellata TaxID=1867833 RepID=A0ABQ5XEA2_9GAMM|nr:acyltransferase family protein [Dyella flagellata]GLQ89622.1 hypothetical protein GCM10007898_31970 [Dyella flagellata]